MTSVMIGVTMTTMMIGTMIIVIDISWTTLGIVKPQPTS
jgi:hypothetical protein